MNGQEMLNYSIAYKETSKVRLAVDAVNNEIVVLRPNWEGTKFHGTIQEWNQLTNEMKSALTQAGLVTRKGQIIK